MTTGPQSFLDACAFTPTSGGTGTWTVSAAIQGYNTPANAGAVDQNIYSYRAEDSTKANWEIGHGTYTASGTTLTRTVLKSSNSNSAVNFASAPNIYIVGLAEDLPGAVLLNSTDIGSAVASVTFTLPSGYKKFKLEGWNLQLSTGSTPSIIGNLSSNGGSTYYNSSGDYEQAGGYSGSTSGSVATATQTYIQLSALNIGTSYTAQFTLELDPSAGGSNYPSFIVDWADPRSGSGFYRQYQAGWLLHTVVANALQITGSAGGNLTSGSFRLWGIP